MDYSQGTNDERGAERDRQQQQRRRSVREEHYKSEKGAGFLIPLSQINVTNCGN